MGGSDSGLDPGVWGEKYALSRTRNLVSLTQNGGKTAYGYTYNRLTSVGSANLTATTTGT